MQFLGHFSTTFISSAVKLSMLNCVTLHCIHASKKPPCTELSSSGFVLSLLSPGVTLFNAYLQLSANIETDYIGGQEA